MLRAMILGAAGMLAAALPATCLAGRATLTLLPREGNTDVYPIVTVPPYLPPGALRDRRQTCASYVMTVMPNGTPKDVRVWAKFPPDSREFARAGKTALEKWTFHPHMVDGQAVAAHNVFFIMSYLVHDNQSAQAENRVLGSHIPGHTTQMISAAQVTLRWLCSQPPLHGVAIVAGGAAPTESAPEHDGGTAANPVVRLPADSLPAKARPGNVRIRFCVDDQGRVADTVIFKSSPRGLYDEAARQALEETRFTARKVNGSASVACGLVVREHFSGVSSGQVGRIEHMTFNNLTGTLPELKIEAEKPVPISLKIPAGTPLPKVAKVEVRMCIEKNGKPSGESVVQADPPQYFDRAALETVSGWRFASRHRRMCDVYQWVRFPLGG